MDTLDTDNLEGFELILAGILPFVGFQFAGPIGCYFGLMLLTGVITARLLAVSLQASEDLSGEVPDMF